MNKMPTFKGYIGYQGAYVSVDEQEAAWLEDQISDQEAEDYRKEHCVLDWEASNGQSIEVWVRDADAIMVILAGKEYRFCEFKAIPASQQAKASQMGIVCTLGPIALNAERKAIVDAAIRKFPN